MILATKIVLLFLVLAGTLVSFNGERLPNYHSVEAVRAAALRIRCQQWHTFILAMSCLAALVALEVCCG